VKNDSVPTTGGKARRQELLTVCRCNGRTPATLPHRARPLTDKLFGRLSAIGHCLSFARVSSQSGGRCRMLRVRDVKMLLFGEPGSRYEGDLYVLFPRMDVNNVCEVSCVLACYTRGCREAVSSTRLFRLPLALCAV
jgi:hypothetical protein